jgi:heterotetrameric sarcosine oxidase delta subunit
LYTIAAVSFLLTCPNCGVREVTDFGFGGEVSARPVSRPDRRELNAYNYFRRNVAGIQREWWFHRSGCRVWFLAERDTRSNEVQWTALPAEAAERDAAKRPGMPPGDADPQTPDASKASGEGIVT